MGNDERKGRPSASSAEQMRDCPASWLRQQGIKETFSSVADSGTRIHAWLAGEKHEPLTLEELGTALECKRLADEWIASLGMTKFKPLCEIREWAADNLFSSKVDLITYNDAFSAVLVVDYKTGFADVTPAADNLQMRWQFLSQCDGEDDFYVAVVAPHGFPQVTVARYGPEHYGPALAEARRIITAAESPDAPAIPGEKQCRYCKAKTTCAEYQGYARQVLPAEIRELPVGAWTPDQRVRFVVAAKAADKLLEDKLAEIKGEVERDPAGNPGLRLRSTGSTRKIADTNGAIEALSGHLSFKGVSSCLSLSVSKIEAAVAAQNEITKKAAAERVQRVLGPLLETTPKQPSLEVV